MHGTIALLNWLAWLSVGYGLNLKSKTGIIDSNATQRANTTAIANKTQCPAFADKGLYSPPSDSSLRNTVLAIHGVFVDHMQTEKFKVLELYRPYFLDMFYIQMRIQVSKTEFFVPKRGVQQIPPVRPWGAVQKTYDCGNYTFRNAGLDENSYACFAELMRYVSNHGAELYPGTPISGFMFLHADFFITPHFTLNKPTDSIFTATWKQDFPEQWKNAPHCLTLQEMRTRNYRTYWTLWPKWLPRVLNALPPGAKHGCANWADLYYVPWALTERWVDLMLHFAQQHLMIEVAVATAIDIFSDLGFKTVVLDSRAIWGSSMSWVRPGEIDAYDGGHRFDLRDACKRSHVSSRFVEQTYSKPAQNPACTTNKLWSLAPERTNCPNTKWIDAMVEADPAPGKIFMAIGCKKGNEAMKWMERWDLSQNHYWSTEKWMQYFHDKLQSANYQCPSWPNVAVTAAGLQCSTGWGCTCQGISDCYGVHYSAGWGRAPDAAKLWWQQHKCTTIPRGAPCPAKGAWKPLKPLGLCVEPMQENIKLLRQASKDLGFGHYTPHGAFHIVQAAVMNKVGKNQTNDLAATAPVKTVDSLKSEFSLPRVDILTISAEGADPYVLQGALETLRTVRYLQFEIHRDLRETAWDKTTLQSVVAMLDSKGFECYWSGNNGHLLSMNRCWKSRFEMEAWGNAACVKRGDLWYDALRRFEEYNY